MPLPESWVDRIFTRLAVRYGTDWTLKWTGLDGALVKTDWAQELERVRPEAISYALGYLPDRVPTVQQFREICNRAPAAAQPPLLDAPKADPARLKRVFEHMLSIAKGRSPTAWIGDLEARQAAGEKLSIAQVQSLANARENLGWNGKGAMTITEADATRTADLKAESAKRVAEYASRTAAPARARFADEGEAA